MFNSINCLVLNVVAISLMLQCILSSSDAKNINYTSSDKFPADFKFGVATSAYQIEGAWNADGKAESIWDRVVHTQKNKVLDQSDGDIACDSYHKMDDDIKILTNLGVNFYRFSIAWTRVLPNVFDNKPNPAGLDYYDRLINKLLENGIEPMVTIFHWDTPQILQDMGGWLNPMIVDYYMKYAELLFEKYGDRVKTWVTFNEPINTCDGGHEVGIMAPRLKVPGIGGYLCTRHVLLAHGKTYRLYDQKYRPTQKGRIGITLDIQFFQPFDQNENEAAERAMQFYLGRYAHPIYSKEGDFPEIIKDTVRQISKFQGYEKSRLPEFTQEEIELIRGTSDFFGLNHYTTILAKAIPQMPTKPSTISDMMVEISRDPSWTPANSTWLYVTPWGFRNLLNWINNEYGPNLEIIVTENGRPSSKLLMDYDRIKYYQEYFDSLLKAIHLDKIKVTGFSAWSLLDNFEWMDGYTERFGLVYVDFNDPNRTRTPKLSASMYKSIVKTKLLDPSAKYSLNDFYNSS